MLKTKENKWMFAFFVLFNIIFFFLGYMNPIYDFYCKGDTNIYINVAKEMLNGSILYQDVFDHKGPFIFFIYLFPNLIKNANWGIFLIDMLLFNIIFYFNFKAIKLNQNYITTYLLLLIECFLLLASYISASPELIALAIISWANYWIISKKYLTPKTIELILAGVFVGVLFWTKYTLGVYLAVVYFYFIIKNFNWKHISYPLIGFLIPTAIVFIYFIINHAVYDLINCYFLVNLGYKSTDTFTFTPALIILLSVISITFIISLIKKNWDIAILSIASFILTIPVFFMTGYTWSNLYTPFIAVPVLFTIFNFEKLKKVFILISIVFSLLFGYMLYTASYGNIQAGKVYHQLDAITEDVNQTSGNIIVFQTEPILPWEIESINYKYFFAPTLTYEQLPEMYEQIYEDVSNQNIDYVVVLLNEDGKIMPLSHFRTATTGELKTIEWVEKISDKIYENYEIVDAYYKFTLFRKRG